MSLCLGKVKEENSKFCFLTRRVLLKSMSHSLKFYENDVQCAVKVIFTAVL